MLGLFGTLNLATRSLATQRQGTEVAGHNLANVNNPAYARQRLAIETSAAVPSEMGPQGTGANAVAILRLRDALLDRQLLSEGSVLGSLSAQQKALQYAQANLAQLVDRQASGAAGASATGGVGGQHGLAEELSGLFNAFQSLSTNPTSTAERQVLLLKAQDLATQFNQVVGRIDDLNRLLDDDLESDVQTANGLLGQIAKLNEQIVKIENGGGHANDLRDVRQQRLEELGKLVSLTTTEQSTGAIEVAVNGVSLVSGGSVLDPLETYDPGTGQRLVRAQASGTPLNPTGGSLHGIVEVRDGALATLGADIHRLASQLITEVNALHAGGFGLAGTTGEAFFTGTDAATIGVNAALLADPSRIQASGVAGAAGDNQVILALAQLADRKHAVLGNQTFAENYGQTVTRMGQSLASLNSQIDNENIVHRMLSQQRDSISGVSLDEEMTDLIRFQKAFEASARLVSVVDEMLDVVIGMKR